MKYLIPIMYSLAGLILGSGIIITVVFITIYRQSIIRTSREILNTLFPSTTPSWKIVMKVQHPSLARPRYLSLHTLATITGRSDLLKLAREMKRSHEVSISFCSTVKSPVFVLREFRRDTWPEVWNKINDFVKTWPFPRYKGFQSIDGYWTDGYGTGRYISPSTAMKEPFIKEDYHYANKMIEALCQSGRASGISKYDI